MSIVLAFLYGWILFFCNGICRPESILLVALFRWVLFTSIFFHGNFKHILLEILPLLVTGSVAEAQTGGAFFLAVFLAGGQDI